LEAEKLKEISIDELDEIYGISEEENKTKN
jgi:hypothetical protein